MSIDMQSAWAGDRPADPMDLVAAGAWLPHPDSAPHPALDGEPVSYVCAELWPALHTMAAMLDPGAVRADPAGAACDVLRLLALAAVPDPAVPDPGVPDADAPWGRQTAPVAELGRRPVLFRRAGGGHGPVVALPGWPDGGARE